MTQSNLVPFAQGQLSSVFGATPTKDALSAGIAASYAILRYKGKVWSVTHRGTDTTLMRPDGDGPMSSVEVVIVGASEHISKVFYEKGYIEGSNAAPDCYSLNGVEPDPNVLKKQCATCAPCPRNKWGSKISEVTGKPGKQCQDSKRLAVVPLQDIPCQIYGGPMLLRVPAASLQDLAAFGGQMHQMGYPHFSYGTKIAFDTQEAFPKFVFSPIRPLTDAEAQQVKAHLGSAQVERILAQESEYVNETPQQQEPAWENPPQASTGPASTTHAQPAAQNITQQGVTQTPATAQAPMTLRQQLEKSLNGGGGAPTANTASTQASGFGTPARDPSHPTAMSQNSDQPIAQSNGSPSKQATPTYSNIAGSGEEPEAPTVTPNVELSEFEAGLDQLMSKLLPR